jgi:probable F420-dependent oxidoreductase
VTFHGRFHNVESVTIGPRPAKPLDIWLGGQAPAALERIGKHADGWLGSFLTPEQAKQGITTIQEAAKKADREIEEDHFGLGLAVATRGDVPEAATEAARRRNPEADPTDLIANGWQNARALLERHIEAGLSKFVIRPATPGNYQEFLANVRTELLPLQN